MTTRRVLGICGALLTALQLSTASISAQTPTLITIYDFPQFKETGSGPQGPLAIGSGGTLYGITDGGGTVLDGTVFSLTPPASAGAAWSETVLHNFVPFPESRDGFNPWNGVAIGSGGALYGTTVNGGSSDYGTVFSLTPPSAPGSSWTETLLYNFKGGDGFRPYASVVIGKGGELYGTTVAGGSRRERLSTNRKWVIGRGPFMLSRAH